MTTTYDTVSYPTVPRTLAHPGHLYAVAKLFGIPAAPVETARVLEIGCGDGGHLIACAAVLPKATFVGFDLSSSAIARGQLLIREAGLANVRIDVGDITTWPRDGEPFDYIIADGIYSWIPANVRESLVELVGRALAPHGVAFISYNVYPGCYTRRMLWEMMKFHVRGIDDPEQKIDEALRMADFIRVSRNKTKEQRQDPFDRDVENVLTNRVRNILYHDELSTVNDPMYLHQFANHLSRHGLQFATEVMPQAMGFSTLNEPIREKIREYAGADRIKREQYTDFATLRRFRQSLVTRSSIPVRSEPDPFNIRELYLASCASYETVNLAPDAPMTFRSEDRSFMTRSPLTKAALTVLHDQQPRRLKYEDMLAAALQRLGRETSTNVEQEELLADLATAWTAGGVLIKGYCPDFACVISERPTASPLARAQLRIGTVATSQLHTTLRLEDPPSRMLVQLMDGTRTIDQIAAALYPMFPVEHRPPIDQFRGELERNLQMLLRAGFLI